MSNVGLKINSGYLIQLLKLINYVKLYANRGGTHKSPNKLKCNKNKIDTVIY